MISTITDNSGINIGLALFAGITFGNDNILYAVSENGDGFGTIDVVTGIASTINDNSVIGVGCVLC